MVLMTLGAWLVAFAVVLTLLTLLRQELNSLPLAIRALVISGVLVVLMVNLVMPFLSMAIARWLIDGAITQPSREHSPGSRKVLRATLCGRTIAGRPGTARRKDVR